MIETATPGWEKHVESGRRRLAQGDAAGADASFATALADAEACGEDSPSLAACLTLLGQVRSQQRDHGAAEALFCRALEVRERAAELDHTGVIQILGHLAAISNVRADYEGAEALLCRALALADRHLPPSHPAVGSLLNNLSRLYLKRADHAKADRMLVRLLQIKQALGTEHPEVAGVLASIASLRSALGKHDVAEQLWRRVLAIRERSLTAADPSLVATLNSLADACAAQGDQDEAMHFRERGLRLQAQALAGGAAAADTTTPTPTASVTGVEHGRITPIPPQPAQPAFDRMQDPLHTPSHALGAVPALGFGPPPAPPLVNAAPASPAPSPVKAATPAPAPPTVKAAPEAPLVKAAAAYVPPHVPETVVATPRATTPLAVQPHFPVPPAAAAELPKNEILLPAPIVAEPPAASAFGSAPSPRPASPDPASAAIFPAPAPTPPPFAPLLRSGAEKPVAPTPAPVGRASEPSLERPRYQGYERSTRPARGGRKAFAGVLMAAGIAAAAVVIHQKRAEAVAKVEVAAPSEPAVIRIPAEALRPAARSVPERSRVAAPVSSTDSVRSPERANAPGTAPVRDSLAASPRTVPLRGGANLDAISRAMDANLRARLDSAVTSPAPSVPGFKAP